MVTHTLNNSDDQGVEVKQNSQPMTLVISKRKKLKMLHLLLRGHVANMGKLNVPNVRKTLSSQFFYVVVMETTPYEFAAANVNLLLCTDCFLRTSFKPDNFECTQLLSGYSGDLQESFRIGAETANGKARNRIIVNNLLLLL